MGDYDAAKEQIDILLESENSCNNLKVWTQFYHGLLNAQLENDHFYGIVQGKLFTCIIYIIDITNQTHTTTHQLYSWITQIFQSKVWQTLDNIPDCYHHCFS